MRPWAHILMLSIAALPVTAQTDEDGPGKGVARISVINGEVSVRRGDSGDLIAAAINAPLVVTDRLLTGPSSRAEVQFDWANMIRLTSNSEIRFAELEHRRYQVQVAIGTVTFRVLRDIDADVEVSTPNVSVRPVKKGMYRISVREDGTSEISVRSGEVEVFTPRGSQRLKSGKTMLARGTAADPEFQIAEGIPFDDWDRWNEARDRDLQRSRSYQYVASDVYGAEDLDHHGNWVNVDSYGMVWAPRVAVGWAPYRYGRWSWIDYYGWSWVSYDPWGWAPYHYGRWFYAPVHGWCWWPGGYGHHYWRPALVAFFGWGSYGGFHAGVGFGWGNVGWVPLAPREPFYPWYGRRWYGGGYRGQTNVIVNNTNVYNVYRNARVTNSMTAVNRDQFGRGHISNANVLRVNESDVRGAGLVRGVLPLTPDRRSVQFADRQVTTAGVSRTVENRTFFSRRPSAVTERVPFEQQRQAVEQVARRTFTESRSGTVAQGGGSRGEPAAQTAGEGSGRVAAGRSAVAEAPVSAGTRADESRVSGSTSRTVQPGGSPSWRRAGESEAPARIQPTDRNSVQRSWAPAESKPAESVSRPEASRSEGNSWRRFGESNVRSTPESSRSETPRVERSAPARVERSEPSRVERTEPSRVERSSPSRVERSEPPRVERSAPAAAPSVERPSRNDDGGGGERQGSARPGRERSDNSGWQRFGTSGSESSRISSFGARSFDSSSSVSERPQSTYSAPRSEARSSERSSGYEPLRISPPIVRERPSQSYEGGGGRSFSGSGGGARMSAPSMSSGGGMSAPRTSGGGGGGSSSRSSGGGGGGGPRGGGGGGGRGR